MTFEIVGSLANVEVIAAQLSGFGRTSKKRTVMREAKDGTGTVQLPNGALRHVELTLV